MGILWAHQSMKANHHQSNNIFTIYSNKAGKIYSVITPNDKERHSSLLTEQKFLKKISMTGVIFRVDTPKDKERYLSTLTRLDKIIF